MYGEKLLAKEIDDSLCNLLYYWSADFVYPKSIEIISRMKLKAARLLKNFFKNYNVILNSFQDLYFKNKNSIQIGCCFVLF